MHVVAVPRHRIETRFADYVGIAKSLRHPNPGDIQRFEREFAAYVGCKHAIAVSSGRLAMHLILEACGGGEGDEAIVPAFNLFAVVERFCQLGIAPRFADVRRHDLTVDPAAVEQRITPRTRFLLVTHMFGHAAAMGPLCELAERHGLTLLEDCAHALGTQYDGRFVGTFGRAAIFSFSVLKLITTFGGGMIATQDDELAERIRERLASLRDLQPQPLGWRKALGGAIMDMGTRTAAFSLAGWPLLHLLRGLRPGFDKSIVTELPRPVRNFDPAGVPPLHPFQGLLGLSQLARVEELIESRRRVSAWLDAALASAGGVQTLRSSAKSRWNGLYYGILADQPGDLSQHLFRHGIDSETSEYLNCADLPMYAEHFVDCPIARDVQSRILRLPNHPGMSRRQVLRIARQVRRFYAGRVCRAATVPAASAHGAIGGAGTSNHGRPGRVTAALLGQPRGIGQQNDARAVATYAPIGD